MSINISIIPILSFCHDMISNGNGRKSHGIPINHKMS